MCGFSREKVTPQIKGIHVGERRKRSRRHTSLQKYRLAYSIDYYGTEAFRKKNEGGGRGDLTLYTTTALCASEECQKEQEVLSSPSFLLFWPPSPYLFLDEVFLNKKKSIKKRNDVIRYR